MSTAVKIIQEIEGLRPEKQSEVLEFVEFLKEKERLVSVAFGHPSKHQTSSSNNISDLNSALI